jgi:hypothetical protein
MNQFRTISTNSRAASVFVAVSLLNVQLDAQDFYSNTTIYIDQSAFIHVSGSVKNDGLIVNNGSIFLQGNWSNNFVYQGSGKIILEGANQQFSNKDQAISTLEVNGGGQKLLLGDYTITANLNLLNGTLKTEELFAISLSETATITGGSEISYIEGVVRSQGNGYKYFPLGINSHFYPIEFIDVKGINPILEVSVKENYPFVTTPNIKKNVYWLRKTFGGTFDGSQVSLAFDPNQFTDLQKIGIAQGESINKPIAIESNEFDVQSGTTNKVTSKREMNGGVFMLGEGPLPPAKAFYMSTALAPRAALSENKTVRVFGNVLSESGFSFRVFNRTGSILFETSSLVSMQETGWDGRDPSTGNYLPSGAYPFILQGLQMDGRKLVKQGVITILN